MTYEQLYDRQIQLEQEAQDILKNKEYRNLTQAIEQGRFDETMPGSALMKTYFVPIRDKIQEYLDGTYVGHTGKTQRYLKYLCDDSSILSFVILQSLIKKLAQRNNQVKVVSLTAFILYNLKLNHTFETVSKDNPKLIAYLGSEYKRASASRKRVLIEKHLKEFKDISHSNTKADDIRIGAILLEIVINSNIGLIEKKRLFRKGIDRNSTLYVSFTDEVFDILTSVYRISPTAALYAPMVVKPKDWTSFKEGGLLSVPHNFMKIRGKVARRIVEDADLSKVYDSINNLQRTSWRVNKKVYAIVEHIYTNNIIDPRSPPTLPNLYGDIPTSVPTEIKDLLEPMEYKDTYTKEEKKTWAIWNRKREGIQIGLDGEKGRRLQYLMSMGLADKMLEYDKFWYAYQLDYRGRVYPMTDFLTPQSKGYVKALLEFGEGVLLNETGLYWLKVHSANCYGLDKELFEDRIQWFEENRLKMLRVADNPMEHLSIWTEADSPFEFLATCFAYQDYTQGLEVHLPIQLDAVNSGIQMYSGLLRDKAGARSTCVLGSLRSDLYAEVAERVEHKLSTNNYPAYFTFTDREGAENVVHTKVEADSLKGHFTRSMTKSNVMTVPYSVSMRGMTMQNWDIMEGYKLNGKDFWKGDEWVVNKLWTELTHDSIYELVQGARAGQQYLKGVVGKLKEPALWHTPMYNLPVFQAMYKTTETRVRTVLGRLSIVEMTDETKRQKQLSSVAANYIHSIDAAILMYIAEHMNGSLGVIHDCFLVHPNEGEQVRDLYKEGYVQIMKIDPLKKFSEELDPNKVIDIPYVGDLELDDVYNSQYIIS